MDFLLNVLGSSSVVNSVATVLGAAATWLVYRLTKKTRRQDDDDAEEKAYARLVYLVEDVVRAVLQEVVDPHRKAGTWTEEAKRQAKDEAVSRVRSLVGSLTKDQIMRSRGLSYSTLDKLVGNLVESAVHQVRK